MAAEHHPELPARREEVDRVAAIWLARREAPLDAAGQAELRAWLDEDPAHAEALARLDAGASELDWPLYSGNLDRVLLGLEARSARRRARRRVAFCSGAAALLLVCTLFSLRWLSDDTASVHSMAVHTPRTLALPDGSTVELQDNAEIRVAFADDARRIELVRGAAHFTVASDPERPFLVSVGAVSARAVGTAFLVAIEQEQVALLVTEGSVSVHHNIAPTVPSAPLALIQAGESVAVERHSAAATHPPRVLPLTAIEAERRLAWRTPRLVFNGTALREVIALMNRHNREQFILPDPKLGSIRLSGTLRADRADALIEMLRADFDIAAARDGERIFLRKAKR